MNVENVNVLEAAGNVSNIGDGSGLPVETIITVLLGTAGDASICVVVNDCPALPDTLTNDPTLREVGQFDPQRT